MSHNDRLSMLDLSHTTQLASALTARGWRPSLIDDDQLIVSSQTTPPVGFEVTQTADRVYLGRLWWWQTPHWSVISRAASTIRDANAGWFANHGGVMAPGLVELVSTTDSEVEWAWSDRVPVFWTITLAMQAAVMTGARVDEG